MPGGDRQVAADDAVAAHEAPLEVEHVHRAAAAAASSRRSRPNSSAITAFGAVPRDERVAVRAVGRDQVVGVAQRARRADDRRLLADRQVQEAADLRLRVHLAGALLEAPDQHHRLEPLARGVGLGQGRRRPRRAAPRDRPRRPCPRHGVGRVSSASGAPRSARGTACGDWLTAASAAPARDELVGLELRQVRAQRAHERRASRGGGPRSSTTSPASRSRRPRCGRRGRARRAAPGASPPRAR